MAENRDRIFGIIYVVLGSILVLLGIVLAIYKIELVAFLCILLGAARAYRGWLRMKRPQQ